MKRKTKIGIIAIVFGVVLILAVTGFHFYQVWRGNQMLEKVQQEFRSPSLSSAIEEGGAAILPGDILPEEGERSSQTPEESIPAIGILRIPKIDLEAVVQEGTDSGVLRFSLGHESFSAQPGQTGNFVVAGHRNYTFGRFFNRLDEVAPQDIISVETQEAFYTYQVDTVKVVEPTEISVMDPTKDATVTLITCTPMYLGTQRLIVQGTLIKSEGKPV